MFSNFYVADAQLRDEIQGGKATEGNAKTGVGNTDAGAEANEDAGGVTEGDLHKRMISSKAVQVMHHDPPPPIL